MKPREDSSNSSTPPLSKWEEVKLNTKNGVTDVMLEKQVNKEKETMDCIQSILNIFGATVDAETYGSFIKQYEKELRSKLSELFRCVIKTIANGGEIQYQRNSDGSAIWGGYYEIPNDIVSSMEWFKEYSIHSFVSPETKEWYTNIDSYSLLDQQQNIKNLHNILTKLPKRKEEVMKTINKYVKERTQPQIPHIHSFILPETNNDTK